MKYFKLFEEFNIDIYEHGRCEVFAFCLSDVMGYDMYFLLDDEAEIETEDGDYVIETVLVHAYCKDRDGNMFDATGQINKDDLYDHAEDIIEPRTIKVSSNGFFSFISDGIISHINDMNLSEIKIYIRNNEDKYKKPNIKQFIEKNNIKCNGTYPNFLYHATDKELDKFWQKQQGE